MNDKFFDLKKEKQDRMLNAAMKYFALHGFQHASTDDIVREAAISKGLIFHYFESKVGLYEFVYEYSVRYMLLEQGRVSASRQEFFAFYRALEQARLFAMRSYPYMRLFLDRALREELGEVLLAVEEKRRLLEEEERRLDELINYDRIPASIDSQKLKAIMEYTIQGLVRDHLRSEVVVPDLLHRDIMDHIEILEKMMFPKRY